MLNIHCFSRLIILATLLAVGLCGFGSVSTLAQSDPLPSWNDGVAKKSIADFVAHVTTQGAPNFVPIDQRIATFDNDGILWPEQPMYFQLAFALVKAMASLHPEWKDKEPFKAVKET